MEKLSCTKINIDKLGKTQIILDFFKKLNFQFFSKKNSIFFIFCQIFKFLQMFKFFQIFKIFKNVHSLMPKTGK